MRLALLLSFASACGSHAETTAQAQPAAQGSVTVDAGVPKQVITATHAKTVALVAVTDDGKAALTSDELGELRFWPTFDGLHEPVVVHGRAPVEVALARAADGFVAALLDNAGGIELLQLAPDGTLRGRRVIAAEPGFEALAAASAVILARRSDQTIVRLDTQSQPLAPQMGEQILAIAARRQVAVAGLADPEHAEEIHRVRQIALAHDLAWGAAYDLPVPLKAPIAISPSGRRIAGIDARSGAGTIIDLLGQPRVIATDIVGSSDETLIGFLDEDRAVFRAGIVIGVPQVTAVADPWAGTRSSSRLRVGRDPAVADGVVISGLGTHLMLADPANTLFLGYRDLGPGNLRVTSNAITYGIGGRVLWLDDALHDRRARDITNDATGGVPVDDHRLLKGTYTYLENDRSRLDVALVDASSGLEVQLGSWEKASNVTYDPETHVLAITGYTSTISRLLLDPEKATVTPLRPLEVHGEASVELFDPAVANGTVAIATSIDDQGTLYETFAGDQKPGTKPLAPSAKFRLADAPSFAYDRTGAIYAMQSKGDKAYVVVFRGGKEVKRWRAETFTWGAVDAAGKRIELHSPTSVMLFDADGHELWRTPMWAVNAVRFTNDGTKLIVNTGGGLVMLDAATGARLATACGWGFGLSTTEPSISEYNVPVVCAEAS
jgi:hypothetical protein